MLSRRHLRIKIFQALYSFTKGNHVALQLGEKELIKSVEKNYELYIYLLSILVELSRFSEKLMEDRKLKRLPSEADLNPNTRFYNNKLLAQLTNNRFLQKKIQEYSISWVEDNEFVKKIYQKVTETNSYKEFMASDDDSYETHAAFIIKIFKNQIADHELLQHILEEKNIHWLDDHYFVCGYVVKTLKEFSENTAPEFQLPKLYKDQEDDLAFIKTLYHQVLIHDAEYEKVIMTKAQNWEADRIAAVDFILMKMAVCELEKLTSIPVKVTLNEYIEISKLYSTPKSRMFINGVLDKLVAELTTEGKIQKRGRGLIN